VTASSDHCGVTAGNAEETSMARSRGFVFEDETRAWPPGSARARSNTGALRKINALLPPQLV
jgi:hypothetical protein